MLQLYSKLFLRALESKYSYFQVRSSHHYVELQSHPLKYYYRNKITLY